MKRNMWLLLAVSAVLGIGLVWTGGGWLNLATANDAVTPLPLDIAVVFDASGSMDFETTCFDCWEPVGSGDPKFDVIANPWPANGNFNPLPDVTSADICSQAPQPIVDASGSTYFVHEAELYSRAVPFQGWQFERRVPGQGFWVIQRPVNRDASGTDTRGSYIRAHPFPVYSQSSINQYPQLQGAAYNNECFDGPDLSGACWASKAAILGEPTPPSTPPYVEYDFTPDWSGNTHVWIRAQGSGNYGWEWNGRSPTSLPAWRKAIFWQIGRADGSNWQDVQGRNFTNLDQSSDNRYPDSDKWRWLKLGSVATTQGVQHTLRLYQGSAGFQVDKIIFTSFAGGDQNTTIDESGSVRGNSSGITTAFKNLLNQNGGKGPVATAGSGTRETCNVCNPVFGQTVDPAQCSCKTSSTDFAPSVYGAGGSGIGCTQVLSPTNQLNNDLFHDEDPIRSEKEGVKSLANLLDPAIDQLALVAYSNYVFNGTTSGVQERVELQCLRWAAVNEAQGVLKCFDLATDPISFTQVIRSVEVHDNTGGTNIPEGLREGLEELGIETPNNTGITSDCAPVVNDKSVCDRQGTARRVLILLTDGIPNDDDNCPATNLWTGVFGQGRRAFDCAIYYAQQAAAQNVSLFTIGLGPSFYPDLMTAMATGTDPTTGDVYFEPRCGQFFPVSRVNDLDLVFEAIVEAARNCVASTPTPAIASVSGYTGLHPLDPFEVQLENHLPTAYYDIYLQDTNNFFRICANVFTDVQGRAIVNCSLASLLPGYYDLVSFFAGTRTPIVAIAPQQVEIVDDFKPPLILSKSGPATAVAGQPILYTLTLTNTLALTINDVLITDTLPAGANYVSGGTRVGNVISWTLPYLGDHETVQTTFTVSATQTITNADYGVTSGDGFRAIGMPPVITVIDAGSPPPITCLEPIVDQSFELSPSNWTVAFAEGVTRSPGQAHSGNFKLSASSFPGFPTNPWFYQTFTVPTWLTATDTSLHLTLYKNINALADGNQPDDQFFALVTDDPSSINSAVAAKVTTPTVVAQGIMVPGPYNPTAWEEVTLSLPLIDQNFIENYQGKTVSLYLYNDSNNRNACSGFCATNFYFDDIDLILCSRVGQTPPDQGGTVKYYFPVIFKDAGRNSIQH